MIPAPVAFLIPHPRKDCRCAPWQICELLSDLPVSHLPRFGLGVLIYFFSLSLSLPVARPFSLSSIFSPFLSAKCTCRQDHTCMPLLCVPLGYSSNNREREKLISRASKSLPIHEQSTLPCLQATLYQTRRDSLHAPPSVSPRHCAPVPTHPGPALPSTHTLRRLLPPVELSYFYLFARSTVDLLVCLSARPPIHPGKNHHITDSSFPAFVRPFIVACFTLFRRRSTQDGHYSTFYPRPFGFPPNASGAVIIHSSYYIPATP